MPSGSTLDLGGAPTLASPGIISSSGTVNLTGTLDDTGGKSLLLNAATGSWTLASP